MKERKLKYCIFCLGIIVIGGMIGLAIYNSVATTTDKSKTISKSNDLIQYLEKAWNIELEDYVEDAIGEVKMHEDEEDTGIIKVKVLKEYEETVIKFLKDNLGEITGNPYDSVPPFPSNSLVNEVETKEWRYTFSRSREGKYAKTRLLFVYVVYDDSGMYIYFWE